MPPHLRTRSLLEHVQPIELLGLTATPERADGLDVLHYFDGRIAAELRVWDAIDQQYLVPFLYYGVHDGLDLTQVPWKRGQGYDVAALTNVYTANHVWVGQLIKQLHERVADVTSMRALGFCVSIEHARFMAEQFVPRGIRARAVWGDSTSAGATVGSRRSRRRCDRRAVHRRPVQRGHRPAECRHALDATPDRERDLVPPAARPRLASRHGQGGMHRARLRGTASPRVPLRPPLQGAARRKPQGSRAADRPELSLPTGGLPL